MSGEEFDFTEEAKLASGELVLWQHDETGRTTILPKGQNPGPRWYEVRKAVDREG
jgi:hypothetical protein